ncbi:uncharacterized protein G2W53_038137 [Senna tora]|uniref:Uncharacterized protein n=1 Tax=Senna tora TaxID=362788 RepID=A0A834SMG5_9FABA|nr:uncharacterized protein G2W53_038137 [Senna tora]
MGKPSNKRALALANPPELYYYKKPRSRVPLLSLATLSYERPIYI